jgi:hypothetical protein
MVTPEETDRGPETVTVSVMVAVPVAVVPEEPEAVPLMVPETERFALPEVVTLPETEHVPTNSASFGKTAIPVTVPVVLIVPVPLMESFVSSSVAVVGMVTDSLESVRPPEFHWSTPLMVTLVGLPEWFDVPVTAEGMEIEPERAAARLARLAPDLRARHFFVCQVSVHPEKLKVSGSTMSISSRKADRSSVAVVPLSETEVVEALESVPVTVPVLDGIVRFTVLVVSVGGE